MTSNVRLCDAVYSNSLLKDISRLRTTGLLCDVTLAVNENEIRAHRIILAAASPYFSAMFSSGMKETYERRIPMEVEFIGLRDVIDYIYTSEIEICEQNVYGVMEVCDLLELPALRPACSLFLTSTINASNCLLIHDRAELLRYHDLAHFAYRYTLLHFCDVLKEEEFLSTSADTLASILESRLLNIANETDVLQCVLKWIRYDPCRSEHFEHLISKIDFRQIPVHISVDMLSKSEEFSKATILAQKQKVETAINSQEKLPCKTRYPSEEQIAFLFGGMANKEIVKHVECYSVNMEKWHWNCDSPSADHLSHSQGNDSCIPNMNIGRHDFAHAARDYEIFVIGGYAAIYELLNSVEYYSIKTNKWTNITPLPQAVVGARAVFVNQKLMVVGGRWTGNKTWVYEERLNMWREVASMREHRSHFGIACVAGCVYAMGGRGNTSNVLASLERYNPLEDCWHTLAPMIHGRYQFYCTSLNEFIYVIGGLCDTPIKSTKCNNIERFNTLTNEWTIVYNMKWIDSERSIIVLGNCICFPNDHLKFNTLCNDSVREISPGSKFTGRLMGGAAALFVPCFRLDNN